VTDLQLYAFFVLPAIIVVLAGIVYLVEARRWRGANDEPDLFDEPGPQAQHRQQ
jgi:hypothetical protein